MIAFREIVIDDAKKILDWRTSERIAKYLKSNIIYNIEAQIKWLKVLF